MVIMHALFPCKKSVMCCWSKKTAVVNIQPKTAPLQVPPITYDTLENHLHLLDSPDSSFNISSLRFTAAAILKKEAAPIENPGITIEFLPEDNTVILIESRGHRISKITRTTILMEELVVQTDHYTLHKGQLESEPVCVYRFHLEEEDEHEEEDSHMDALKAEIVAMDSKGIERDARHPRLVRYLGTCFDPVNKEALVITDFVVGATLREMWRNSEMRELMTMTETEKIRAAADIADAVFFLHGRSKPIAHGLLSLSSVVIDGETHRAKLVSHHASKVIRAITKFKTETFISNTIDGFSDLQEKAPEMILVPERMPDVTSDMWSLGATILELLFDRYTWDLPSLMGQYNLTVPEDALKMALQLHAEPSIQRLSQSSNPKLHFLFDCLQYRAQDRPTASFVSQGLQQCLLEIQSDKSSKDEMSFLVPGQRINVTSTKSKHLDPLIQQQIEWNVRQDAGIARRGILFGNRHYLGKKFKNLSVTSLNDVKDMTTLLQSGGFALGNIFENVGSSQQFDDILTAYVGAVNKEQEDIELLLLYYAGHAVQGLPSRLARKRRLGIFLDRVGICHDLALVAENESLFPVARLQTILAGLSSRVKRKVIILDCRITKKRKGNPAKGSVTAADRKYDWKEVPVISEECLDKMTTMFTIYPLVEDGASLPASDSHPSRTNGFLTGCLLNLLKDYSKASIEDLPRLLNAEIDVESKRAKAFQGIECTADYISVGNNIWMTSLLEP